MTGKWKETIELTGILGIIASLIFLAFEIRQSRQVGQAEHVAAMTDAKNHVRELLLAHADTWSRGCAGEELSAAEKTVYAQITRAYISNLYWTWESADNALIDLGGETAINTFAANFHRYPGFAAMALEQTEWFKTVEAGSSGRSSAFGDGVTERILELRRTEPDPDFDPALCGL